MDSVVLLGKTFSYKITRKSMGSLRLHLTSSKSFSVSCPHMTPNFIINRFIQQHASWIVKHSPKVRSKTKLSSLTSLTILDQKYPIFLNKLSSKPLKIDQFNHQIILKSPSSLITGLKPFALKLIKSELDNLQNQFPFTYRRVTVRNQKTRFGSCSSTGSLNFNWQIILFPIDKFRHVLFHEIAHLKIKNHSSAFWQLLAQYDPDWKNNNLWLKKEGTKHFIV